MKRYFLLLIALYFLVACGSAPPTPTPSPLPTVRQDAGTRPPPPPTIPPSPGAIPTDAPTATPTPLPTFTPAPTPSPTPTLPAPAQLFVNLELVAEGFTAPVDLAEPRDGSGRLFIADQIGLIRVLSPDGTLLPQPLLDLRARIVALEPGYDERGLLGFALHPDFATPGSDGAGLFYVYYSAPRNEATPSDYDHTGRLSAFRMMADDVNRADLFSEQVILEIPEPQFNHNGGQVAFGPDGYLYLGLGDGGAQNDSGIGHEDAGNGQSLYTLLGKILRLDVIHPAPQHPYSIPWDNPFGGGGGDPLIFAYGFRNPYRFSFDAGGAYGLLVADVGQNLYEEINQVTLGGNYGWRIREGYTCFDVANADAPLASCASTGATGEPLLDPIMAYDRSVGRSVIGGFVYRGQDVPALVGRYVFGDWEYDAQGRLRLFTGVPTATGEWVRSPLTVGAGSPDLNPYSYLLAFGQDANLSLYALTTQALGPAGSSGKVFRLVRAVRP